MAAGWGMQDVETITLMTSVILPVILAWLLHIILRALLPPKHVFNNPRYDQYNIILKR
jgi:hypothetical protein